jgi:hypothetical protein
MTWISHREEFFVENGILVRRTGRRPRSRRQWPNSRNPNLAVAVEMTEEGIHRVVRGPKHTLEHEVEAVTRTYGFVFNENAPDMSSQLPTELINRLRTEVDAVVDNVTSRFRSLSNEERMTGALFGQLPKSITIDNWHVRFHSQGYSSVQSSSKETQTGADAGLIIEVYDGTSSIVKALWLQAKRVLDPPEPHNIFRLPRLKEQMATMEIFTEDGYALIFTAESLSITDGVKSWSFSEWLVGAAQCQRGDRSARMITNTLDRDYLLEMTITQRTR